VLLLSLALRRVLEPRATKERQAQEQIGISSWANAPCSDASEESAGIQSVFWVELIFYGAHEGEGIACSAPGVERRKLGRVVEQDQAGIIAVERGSEECESGLDALGIAIETEPADAGGLRDAGPSQLVRLGSEMDALDGFGDAGRKDAELYNRGSGAGVPKFLGGGPDGRRRGLHRRLGGERSQLRLLRGDACFGALEENVDTGLGIVGEARLERGVR